MRKPPFRDYYDAAPKVPLGQDSLSSALGRRSVYTSVLASCSADDAECLHGLRQRRDYRRLDLTWDRFCSQRLGMHRSKADEIIRYWTEFGADYFTLRQIIGISPEDYRLIRGCIVAGQFDARIPLRPEYATDLLAAIREKTAAARKALADQPIDPDKALASVDRMLNAAVSSYISLRESFRGFPKRQDELERLARIAAHRMLPHLVPFSAITDRL